VAPLVRGTSLTSFDILSTTSSTPLYPPTTIGRSKKKSMVMCSHGQSGAGKG